MKLTLEDVLDLLADREARIAENAALRDGLKVALRNWESWARAAKNGPSQDTLNHIAEIRALLKEGT